MGFFFSLLVVGFFLCLFFSLMSTAVCVLYDTKKMSILGEKKMRSFNGCLMMMSGHVEVCMIIFCISEYHWQHNFETLYLMIVWECWGMIFVLVSGNLGIDFMFV